MELLYLYIRNYQDIFMEKEFNFSSNYDVKFKDNCLSINPKTNGILNYYGENINNIVLFLGQNGMGKTTLLDILGMTRSDRSDDTYIHSNGETTVKHSYFILYHLYDDYFGFEFIDDSFIEGSKKIININMNGVSKEDALYKTPMGTIFQLKNEQFSYIKNIMNQWLRNQNVAKQVKYFYLTTSIYNKRLKSSNKTVDYDYMVERKYYLGEAGFEYQYKYLISLKELNSKTYVKENRYISIKNIINMDYDLNIENSKFEEYINILINKMDNNFDIRSDVPIVIEKKILNNKKDRSSKSNKERFLHTFYVKAIEFYFFNQLVGWGLNENKNKNIDIIMEELYINNVLNDVEELDENIKNKYINAPFELKYFQKEYAFLLYQIKKNTNKAGVINLRPILKYVLDRVEITAKSIVDIGDKNAVLSFVDALEEVPSNYFLSKDRISIDCNVGKASKEIIKLLSVYDLHYSIRNSENGSNNLLKLIGIKMPSISEGFNVYLNTTSKVVSAINESKPGDSVILLLDEPDKSLHPELARRFIDNLVANINQYKDRKVQVILTSHSPFIVTDILPEGVYAIDVDDGKRVLKNKNNTYATNIYYLLMDSFMLENTFGEYSYRRIKDIIKVLSSEINVEKEQLDYMYSVIDRIGEKTLKNKLMQLYDKYNKESSNNNKLIKKLANEKDSEKLRKIEEILNND